MSAQHRSEQQAIQIAKDFLEKKGLTVNPHLFIVPNQKVEDQVYKKVAAARQTSSTARAFYILNDEASNRFVIVSADERLHTILG